jgi:AcrR family transcriptional regulator
MLPATHLVALETTEPDRLRSRKKERTRLAIEDAALDLFAEQGYEDTTVEQIAARAEISKATFFRYFASKGEVIFGVDDERHRDFQRAIIERPRSEDGLTAVRAAMREQWLPTVDPLRTARQTRAARKSSLLRGLSFDLSTRWQADVSDALAQRRGLRVPDRRCRLVAWMAFAVLSNAVNLWLDENCMGDLVTAIDEGFDLLKDECGTESQSGSIRRKK